MMSLVAFGFDSAEQREQFVCALHRRVLRRRGECLCPLFGQHACQGRATRLARLTIGSHVVELPVCAVCWTDIELRGGH